MENLPGISDTTLVVMILVGAAIGAMFVYAHFRWPTPRPRALRPTTQGLGANADLLHYVGDARHHVIQNRHRPAWFTGVVIGLALIALVSWTSQRDDHARIADAALRDTRLAAALKNFKCPEPAAPLEKLLVTIGTQADGKRPEVHCTYITADMGQVPRIRYKKPQVYAARD
jgi:hypothetical protein